jgi:hypothetical protein
MLMRCLYIRYLCRSMSAQRSCRCTSLILVEYCILNRRTTKTVCTVHRTNAFSYGSLEMPGTNCLRSPQRYYHLYQQGELEGLIEQASGLRIVESGYDCDNWFVICERLDGH